MDYPSNNKSAPNNREKRVETVVLEGTVVQRKKTMGKRLAFIFVSGSPRTASANMINEVLIPSIKRTLLESSKVWLESLIMGNDFKVKQISSSTGRTAYHEVRKQWPSQQQKTVTSVPQMSYQARANHDFSEFVIKERAMVTEILDQLRKCIEDYGQARVTDLYDAMGITSDFTDEKWGWTDLSEAGATFSGDGYRLNLPPTSPIN